MSGTPGDKAEPAPPHPVNQLHLPGIVGGGLLVGIEQQNHWQSPYPPPEAIERYERVLPGAFDRILKLVETAQDASIRQGAEANSYRFRETRRGHYLGAVVALGAIAGAVVLALNGAPVIAGALLAPPVLAVAYALVARWPALPARDTRPRPPPDS